MNSDSVWRLAWPWTQMHPMQSYLCLSWSWPRPRCVQAFWFWSPALDGDGISMLTFPWHNCLSLSSSSRCQCASKAGHCRVQEVLPVGDRSEGVGGKAAAMGEDILPLTPDSWSGCSLGFLCVPLACDMCTHFHWRLRGNEITTRPGSQFGF